MEKIGIGRITLKKQTRANVLKTIKNYGPISRVDIAARLGLTRAAVTIISDELMSQGIITEVGSDTAQCGKKSQGRRKILIDINANYKFALGVYAASDFVSIGLSTLNGDSLDKINIEATNKKFSSLENFCGAVCDAFKKLLSDNYLNIGQIIGAGVGCDASFYQSIGLVNDSGETLTKMLTEALHKAVGLPVCTDNSYSTLALANIYFPEKRGDSIVSSAVFLQCSDRFGMIELSEYPQNSNHNGRDWNFIENYIVNFGGRELSGYPKGSLQAELSLDAVRSKIAQRCPYISKELINMILEGYNSESVSEAAEVKNECLRMFGTFLFNIALTTHTQKIILHKFWFSDNDFSYLIKYLESKYSNSGISKIVCKSRVDDKNAFLGGCALAVREFFVECGGLDLKIVRKA